MSTTSEPISALSRPLQEFLERAPYPVAVQDDGATLVYVNPAFAAHFGVERAKTIGRSALRDIPETERAAYLDWMRGWRQGRAAPGRLIVQMVDGARRPHLLLPHHLLDAAGVYRGTAVTLLDEAWIAESLGDRLRASGAVLRGVLSSLVDDLGDVLRRSDSVDARLDRLRRSVPALRDLSEREWMVASRIATGDRTSLVAAELGISANTVRNHLKAVFRKTGVRSQAELVQSFRHWRQLEPENAPAGPGA